MTADPHAWRLEQYLAMGFSHDEALALARSRDEQGFHVYHGDVRKALDAGMSRKEALDVFVGVEVKV